MLPKPNPLKYEFRLKGKAFMDWACLYSNPKNALIRLRSGEFGGQVSILKFVMFLNRTQILQHGRVNYPAERGHCHEEVYLDLYCNNGM